jgi:pantetheine-phosphate adenylyltransferase
MEMIRESADEMGADPGRIEVDSFDGLLVSYAQRRNSRVILRGLRAVADFEYELQMANMNRHLNPEVETVFIMANDAYFYVASNLVKEVTRLGGNVADLVPGPVLPRLLAKFDK